MGVETPRRWRCIRWRWRSGSDWRLSRRRV